MSTREKKLNREELARAFRGELAERFPAILTPAQLAALVQLSVKTVYEWIGKGRLEGAFRKRGKHVLIWRDRALEIIFNGKDWD